MRNELFTIGPFTVYGYGLMIAIGAFAAYLVSEFRAKRLGLKHELIFALFWWCLGGGILGAKLLYIITQLKEIAADPSILLNVSEGFVVYGGIIGGILGGFIFCRIKKLEFLKYFDLVMPSIALAQAFGRVGCTFAGCCYGNDTDSVFHIIFHESKFAPNDIALIPTQPLSSGLNFLNFVVLVFLSKRVKADGQIAGFYLIFYSAGRFILEFFRGDLVRGHIGVLSTSQFIAIFLFLFGIALVIFCGKNPKLHKAPLSDNKVKDSAEDSE
jgi:phosphatidylglycerol---prolipoprotein diacylglyceryl transferase